jgi:adenylyl- and sulfurtransferase ThiI
LRVALVFPSASTGRRSVVNAIKRSGAARVVSEGPVIVCKVQDSQFAKLTGISGIDRVAEATQVPREFSYVVGAIVEAGVKAIMPGEKFYVRAVMAAKADYVERDVEFSSAGALVEKAGALPAKSEQEADGIIIAVVGKRAAYVCVTGKP